MINILFMAPYSGIRNVIEEVFAERPDRETLVPHIRTSCRIDPGEDIRRFDVVISRGFSADDFRDADIPHVEMRVTGYDIIHAIRECAQRYRSRRVAVIGTASMIDGAGNLDGAFGGIISFGLDGGIEMMNKYAASFFGLPPDAGGDDIGQLMPELDYAAVVQGGKTLADILTLRKSNRVVAVNCTAVSGSGAPEGAVLTFQDVTEIQELEGAIRQKIHQRGFAAKYRFDDICHRGEPMRESIEIAKRYATVDSNVLLFGETGAGKELLAQSIHNASRRRNRPFVAINCAALPEHLLESELFGYTDGAFTGAVRGGKTGLFELAHGGTIFLDEIGDIPLNLQPRLLRVI